MLISGLKGLKLSVLYKLKRKPRYTQRQIRTKAVKYHKETMRTQSKYT